MKSFLIDKLFFNKSFQKIYLPQPLVVPSLVPPRLNGLIRNLEIDHFNGKMAGNQIATYYNGHHFNMSNHFLDNENHSNVLNLNEFPMNLNELLQEAYLHQPPTIHSLVVCFYFSN